MVARPRSMLRRVLLGPLLIIALMPAAACLDALYYEGEVLQGEWVLCCALPEANYSVHPAAEGENGSHVIFPACSCDRGLACTPLYGPSAVGCSPLSSATGGGGGSADAGAGLTDAGSADGGSGTLDAGTVGTDVWAACCIDSLLQSCLCPTAGPCAPALFQLCGGRTCSRTGVCPSR